MKTVWVIEDGEYSDYRVEGVYSSREQAEVVQKYVGGKISEWPLDPCVEELNAGLTQFEVWMKFDGDAVLVQPVREHYRRVDNSTWIAGESIRGYVWGRDDQQAVKAMNERRIQHLATGRYANEED